MQAGAEANLGAFMKLFVRSITLITAAVLVLGTCFVAAMWFSEPSISEMRTLALSRSSFCATLYDRDGRELGPIYGNPTESQFTPLDSLPRYGDGHSFVGDLVFYEDKTFWSNIGVSPTALIRAVLEGGSGASTLTMQLWRIISHYRTHSYFRKLSEIVAAAKLTLALSKSDILQLYINDSWFGGGQSVGIATAAEHFFSKRPSQLSRAEGLMLISFLNHGPDMTALNEVYNKYYSRVQRLVNAGLLTQEDPDYNEIVAGPVFHIKQNRPNSYGVFLDGAVHQAGNILLGSGWSLATDGLKVFTSLDADANEISCRILSHFLEGHPGTTGSFLLLNQDNEILAYVSGGLSARGDFDILSSPYSLPSSTFKIFVYSSAIEHMLAKDISPSAILSWRVPTVYRIGDFEVNDDVIGRYTSIRKAIALSLDGPAYYVANRITTPRDIAALAEDFSAVPIKPYPSIAMGTQGYPQLDLAVAYGCILNRAGFYRKPSYVDLITTQDGDTLFNANKQSCGSERRLVPYHVGLIMKEALREGVQYGTSMALKPLSSLDISAKTGTSNGNHQLVIVGVINGRYTFLLSLQSTLGFKNEAGHIAVPLAARILQALQAVGQFGVAGDK